MFTKKTIHDVRVDNKTVLVSVDYNLPGDDKGEVTSDYRLRESLPTLNYLLDRGCRLILISHRGRPGGKVVPALSLKPVAKRLHEVLKRPVAFAEDCVGEVARRAKQELPKGGILLLENTRFHPGEEADDPAYARELAEGADLFVQEAFGRANSSHVSLVGIPRILPSVAGLLVEKEVNTITEVMSKPKRPLAAIIGGAKIADKLEVLKKLMDLADFVAIGGAMANTFLAAQGYKMGKSLYDADELKLAREILSKADARAKKQKFTFYLPEDGVVATSLDADAKTRVVQFQDKKSGIDPKEMILDAGPTSADFMAGGVQLAGTVIWNGTLGVTETSGKKGGIGPFAHGTETIIGALTGKLGAKPFSLVGGGDTVGYVEQRGLTQAFSHVSTGGGASLQLMAGRNLPGVEALQERG